MKTKYDIGQEVFIMVDGRVRKLKVNSIKRVKRSKKLFYGFREIDEYNYHEDNVFKTINELIESIKNQFPEEFPEEKLSTEVIQKCDTCEHKFHYADEKLKEDDFFCLPHTFKNRIEECVSKDYKDFEAK